MASEQRDLLLDNLRRLRLPHAACNLDEHIKASQKLGHGHIDFLARLVEAEVLARNHTGTQKRIQQACFPEVLTLDGFDFKSQPAFDRKQLADLASLGFIDRCESVIFIGPSGVGKTHLAIALGVCACQAGYLVRFVRAYELLKSLYASLADDSLDELITEFAKPRLLIIDELGNSPRKPEHDYAGVLFELIARRHRRGTTVVTTNFGFDQWSTYLGAPMHVTPALDRLLEGAHIIIVPNDAPSFRDKRREGPGPLPKRRTASRKSSPRR
jgi:DNA replication protein DnaC